ncbi:MAG TPA: S41 family peptidase, partial [Phycisphaerales bacterium]|nr:S41 family peptidase [Phycisphaerales bacterium]
ATVNQYFSALPADLKNSDSGERFHDSVELANTNKAKAAEEKQKALEKAHSEMLDAAGKDKLPAALIKAVEVQMLLPKLDDALADPEIMKLIGQAKSELPDIEKEGDWLHAQELIFYLKTLYEDTTQRPEYDRISKELDWVNTRLSLLAEYAPKHLYDLRQKRAERNGDKALNPFNPAALEDWRETLKGVDARTLKECLRVAATQHIEARGWAPLLKGGLESLKILVTTSALSETFPLLSDADKVSGFVSYVDGELKNQQGANAHADQAALSRILDGLTAINDQTVQLPAGVIYREFGDGAMAQLDEYSEIIWPDKLLRFNQSTEGRFTGVGIIIRHNDAREIVVVNPLEGTPAYFAGIKPDDIIAEVDGESAVGWSLNDAVDRITGDPDTKVTIGIKRKDVPDVINYSLKRDVIKLRTVMGWYKKDLKADGEPDWNWYIDPASRIAYVKLSQFTEDTYPDLLEACKEMSADNPPKGLILDLRYNPGGLLTSAFYISNLFVKSGMIVSGEDKYGDKPAFEMKASPVRAALAGLPTVVLVNNGSASASEIVSGCLQAHGAALVIGERSFGKGSVQTVPNTSGNARIKVTTQYYRLPPAPGQEKGRLVHKRLNATDWGVKPDLTVPMTPEQLTQTIELRQQADLIPQDADGKLNPNSPDRPDVNRLLTEGLDPQLETALLLLQARVLGETDVDTKHAARDTDQNQPVSN